MLDRALGSCPAGSAVQVTVLQADPGMQCLLLIDPGTSLHTEGRPPTMAAARSDGDSGAIDESTGLLPRTLAAEG